MATIWDADVLIWAASQIVEARDAGLRTSRLMAATPYEILTFVGRGTSARDYHRLKAALDRLQSTTVVDVDPPADRAPAASLLLDQRMEGAHDRARPPARHRVDPAGLVLRGVLDDALVLTIDRAYFDLTGGLERWLYRLVRKHGGRQHGGWRFDFRHLHPKSGSLSPLKHFAFDLREIVRRQPLPGYPLVHRSARCGGRALLAFRAGSAVRWNACGQRSCYREPRTLVPSGTAILVLSGTEIGA